MGIGGKFIGIVCFFKLWTAIIFPPLYFSFHPEYRFGSDSCDWTRSAHIHKLQQILMHSFCINTVPYTIVCEYTEARRLAAYLFVHGCTFWVWRWLWAAVFVCLTATTDLSVFRKVIDILSDCNLAEGLQFSIQLHEMHVCVCVCVPLAWFP